MSTRRYTRSSMMARPIANDRPSEEQDHAGHEEDRLAGAARLRGPERRIHDREPAAGLGALLVEVHRRAEHAVGERLHALALLVDVAAQVGVLGLERHDALLGVVLD